MSRKKINKFLHKWLSIPLGVIVFIVCLTGAALIFQKEILELSNPSHYYLENVAGQEAIPLDELIPMVNAKLEDNSVANVEVTKDASRTYKMGLAEGFRISVFVNQYTGEITGRYAVKEHPFFTVMSLHRWLLDGTHTWGKNIVGWATLLFVVIIITGICYVSKTRKESYKIQFNKGTRRLMYGLHNALGLYAALALIVFSLTGLMWSFEWYRNGVFSLFGAESTAQENTGRPEKKEKPEINTIHWQTALENTLTPQSKYDYVRISDGMVSAHPDDTYRGRVQDKIIFDKNSGEIKKITLFEDQDVKTKVWAWAYSLHVGDYWGIWSKIISFVFCLIGASLPVTGYYFTIASWKKKRKRLAKGN